MLDDLDLTNLPDERTRTLVVRLLNLIEELAADNRALRDELQRLRDENNRLKGEQGKPNIKPPSPPRSCSDHSSEPERHQPTPRVKRGKRTTISINREQTLVLDRAQLPPDAEFKGYDDVLVQDLRIQTDNVLFHKEVWYSASTRQS